MLDFIIAMSVIGCIAWCVLLIRSIYLLYEIPRFELLGAPEPETPPRVSIIVPACNEGEGLAPAIKTLVELDYPNKEIILIDDRSTDQTGRIADELEQRYEEVQVAHVQDLPSGWLGKLNAMQTGLQLATGDWLLFTDADIHFQSDTLSRAIAIAKQQELDHITLMPQPVLHNYWLEVAINTFGIIFLSMVPWPRKPGHHKGRFAGVGAFNLVRRPVFDKTPGLRWLRMDVADDMGLGMMLNMVGAKSLFAVAREHLHVSWYNTVTEMFQGLEKNLFGAGAHYQPVRMILLVLSTWALVFSPLVALLAVNGVSLLAVLLMLIVLITFSVFAANLTAGRFSAFLALPVGMFMMSLMMLRAGIHCLSHGGIFWRDTFYPVDALKAKQRVKL